MTPSTGPPPEKLDALIPLSAVAAMLAGAILNRVFDKPLSAAALPFLLAGVLLVITIYGRRQLPRFVLALLAVGVIGFSVWGWNSRPGPLDGTAASLRLPDRNDRGQVGESTFVWIDYSGLSINKHALWLLVRTGSENFEYYPKVDCTGGLGSQVQIDTGLHSWADTVLVGHGPVAIIVAVTTRTQNAGFLDLLAGKDYCRGGNDNGPRQSVRAIELARFGFKLLAGEPARVVKS